MKKKSFVLMEQGNDDCPSMGVIKDVSTVEKFKEKFLEIVGQHFDIVDFNHEPLPDVFDGGWQYEVGIEEEGRNHFVSIYETWIY